MEDNNNHIEVKKYFLGNLPFSVEGKIITIGDLHGQGDLHTALAKEIQKEATPDKETNIIYLGDYIDRGPNSIQILDDIQKGYENAKTHYLMGNHEQFLYHALTSDAYRRYSRKDALLNWIYYGGIDVCEELKLFDDSFQESRIKDYYTYLEQKIKKTEKKFQKKLREKIGEDRLNFIKKLDVFWRQDRLLLVHAGVHPSIDLKNFLNIKIDYMPENFEWHPLWIREKFLTWDGSFEENIFVIHGHTIQKTPILKNNKLGIDTGSFNNGCITAAVIENDTIYLIQANRKGP